jgi:hypothetical protein
MNKILSLHKIYFCLNFYYLKFTICLYFFLYSEFFFLKLIIREKYEI